MPGSVGIEVTFLLDSKSLFIFLSRVSKNVVSVFSAKFTNPKSTKTAKGTE